eukprot:m51a1_g9055 putative proteasome subunit alpha type 3 (250) ;mRNA; r:58111-59419
MSSIGTGYDYSCTTISPDGRVFQVEYATKAADNSGTVVGIRCTDGVVLGVEKIVLSKMLVDGSNRRTHILDDSAGVAVAGLIADARQMVKRGRSEANSYRDLYQSPIPTHVLADRLGSYVQSHTLYNHLRPFGCSVLLAGHDDNGYHLFSVEPSGYARGFFATALGKGKQTTKTELEKVKFNEITCREALLEVARLIITVHGEDKEKPFELELSWVCKESDNKFQLVPKELRDQIFATAKEQADAAMNA